MDNSPCMKKFNVILASDNRGGIGNKRLLPWNFKKDTDYYIRKITTNSSFPTVIKNILIMGYKSFIDFFQSNICSELIYVIARDSDKLNSENTTAYIFYFDTFEQALQECQKETHSDIWILGGKKIYEDALSHYLCDKIYLTTIDAEFECDTIVDLSIYNINWSKIISVKDINLRDNNEYTLTFKKGSMGVTYTKGEHLPVEILNFYTKPEFVDEFIKADYNIWTLRESINNNIAKFPFFRKEVWLNDNNPGEITIVHIWKSIELWKAIDKREFQKKCIEEFNAAFGHPYRLLSNVDDSSFWKRYRHSKYEVK